MVGYQAQAQRQRVSSGNTRQRAQFSFAAAGAVIALLGVIGSAGDGFTARAASVTPTVALLSDIPSHNRAYRASMIPLPDPLERNRSLTWTIEIRTLADAPVEGASLALESWMPDDETVSAVRPRAIAELGGGFYRVEGLRFDSHGWWNLRLQISAAGMTDSLAFNMIVR